MQIMLPKDISCLKLDIAQPYPTECTMMRLSLAIIKRVVLKRTGVGGDVYLTHVGYRSSEC